MSATATFPLYALGAAELLLAALLVMPLTSLNRVGLSLLSICKSHAGGVVSMTTAAFLLAFTAGGIIMSSKPAVNELRPSSQASASDQLLVVSAVADLAGGVLLWRLSSIMSAHEKLLLSHTMLQKQAQNMQVEYLRLLDAGKGDAGKGDEGKGDDEQGARVVKLDQRNAALAKENDTLMAERKTAEARAEAIKRQATSTAAEYERLLEENESLKDQLQLKDALESLSGGSRKKDS